MMRKKQKQKEKKGLMRFPLRYNTQTNANLIIQKGEYPIRLEIRQRGDHRKLYECPH
jgi:hypothetical protein